MTEVDEETIYECWVVPEEALGPDDAHSICFAPRVNIRNMLAKKQMTPNSAPLYSVRAGSWNEAMATHYVLQGWGPYKPMEEDADT